MTTEIDTLDLRKLVDCKSIAFNYNRSLAEACKNDGSFDDSLTTFLNLAFFERNKERKDYRINIDGQSWSDEYFNHFVIYFCKAEDFKNERMEEETKMRYFLILPPNEFVPNKKTKVSELIDFLKEKIINFDFEQEYKLSITGEGKQVSIFSEQEQEIENKKPHTRRYRK